MAFDAGQQVWEISRLALANQGGRVAVFEFYMDESGTHGGSPVVTVAGYIGCPDTWAEWTQRWTEALGDIEIYHAVDAQNLDGEFKDWTSDQVADLAQKLLPIIAEADIAAVVVGLDLRVFDAALAG
jgi:hypothetical protein